MQSADCVKVLTIKQPFASLLLRGIKKFELRNWETSYRGLVYLHASASPHPLLLLKSTFAVDRMTAGFEYCGPPLEQSEAEKVWS